MNTKIVSGSRIHRWGGLAFAFGNLLFMANKLDEMSRLFLGRVIPDVISGQNFILILLGQTALVIGYITYYQFYSQRVNPSGKNALRLLSGGGITLAIGHFSFISALVKLLPFVEYLFFLVFGGLLLSLIGLIWFGILTLRRSVLHHWHWLPLVTGLMGLIGFFVFRGEEITAIFLLFRTLFALGLIGLGVLLWMEPENLPLGS